MRLNDLRPNDPMAMGQTLRMADDSGSFVPPNVRPSDHLEPSGVMRRVDDRLKRQDFMLNELAKAKQSALEWKTLWLCEVMRGDHEFEETYRVGELDRAREKLIAWDRSVDKFGNITAEYES